MNEAPTNVIKQEPAVKIVMFNNLMTLIGMMYEAEEPGHRDKVFVLAEPYVVVHEHDDTGIETGSLLLYKFQPASDDVYYVFPHKDVLNTSTPNPTMLSNYIKIFNKLKPTDIN